MFIYRITVLPIGKVYIGFDTHEEYRKFRWKQHCRNVKNSYKQSKKTKLLIAMVTHGIDNCKYEVISNSYSTIRELALAEIQYIKEHNSYYSGLNGSLGGDGLGYKELAKMSDADLEEIKSIIGNSISNYNKNIKWANTTLEDRRAMLSSANSDESVKKRKQSLKEYYEAHPEVRKQKSDLMKISRRTNKAYRDEQAKLASNKAAQKNRTPIKVIFPTGETKIYSSQTDFRKETNEWPNIVLQKTITNGSWHGYKAWKI